MLAVPRPAAQFVGEQVVTSSACRHRLDRFGQLGFSRGGQIVYSQR